MILKKEKIIFIHAPRTSGTSIENQCLSGRQVPDGMKHFNAKMMKKVVGQQFWNESFKFSIVRNPWDRVISLYHMPYFGPGYRDIGALSGKTLESFITKYSPAPWEHGVQCSDYLNEEVDFIIRFENRQNDLAQLSKITDGLLTIDNKVHHRATKRKKNYVDFYNQTTRKMVEEMYHEDMARFNYKFGD